MTEGLIEGVDPCGLPAHGDISWLALPLPWLPERIHISSHANEIGVTPWPSIGACANWILAKARQLDVDWLLNVEADEELHDASDLRARLAALPAGTLSVPLARVEPSGVIAACNWKLLNARLVARYLNGHVVELHDGRRIDLVAPGQIDIWPGPWLSHHPERRPPWRRHIRLGDYENVTDPIIREGLHPLPVSSMVASVSEIAADETAGVPAWYCPGCGARYHASGSCAWGHEPLALLLDPDVAAPAEAGATTTSGGADATVTLSEAAPESVETAEPAPDASPEPLPEPPPAEAEAAAAPAEPTTLDKAKEHLHAAFDLLAQL